MLNLQLRHCSRPVIYKVSGTHRKDTPFLTSYSIDFDAQGRLASPSMVIRILLLDNPARR